MPQRGRSRQAAARQTQLGQKKKRHARVSVGESVAAGVGPPDGEATATTRPEAPAAQIHGVARPATTRPPEPRPLAYSYLVPELKRILGIAGSAFAILVILTFVLR